MNTNLIALFDGTNITGNKYFNAAKTIRSCMKKQGKSMTEEQFDEIVALRGDDFAFYCILQGLDPATGIFPTEEHRDEVRKLQKEYRKILAEAKSKIDKKK